MLRKLEQNIFPEVGRQVHAIIVYRGGILPFEGEVDRPILEGERERELLQAADALAIQVQIKSSLNENPALEFLGHEVIFKGLGDLDHPVMGLDVQLAGGHFPLKMDIFGL
jgi:hypothetical protein